MSEEAKVVVSIESILRNFDRDSKRLDAFKKRLESLARVKVVQQKVSGTGFDRATLSAQRFAQAQQRVEQASKRIAIAQRNIETANLRAATSFERAKLGAERLRKEQERFASTSKRTSGFLAGAAGGLTALVGVSAINSIRRGAAAWFEYSSNLEATKIAFTTMLGSEQEAEKHLKELQQFALTTPFQFQELVDASQRMQALGFEANQVVPILNDVGNAVAAAGGGSERLDRVVLALSQIQSKGKLATQEMNQLAEAGIPAWKILEQQFGRSRSELVKLVEQGQISSKVFLDAFQKFSQANFGGLMEKQSKTAIGALSNIKDAVLQLSDKAFEPLFRMVSDGLNSIAKDLQTNQSAWEAWGRKISDTIAANVGGIITLVKELQALDRQIGESLNLPSLAKELEQEADRQAEGQTRQLVTAIALLNSLRGGRTGKPQRFEDEGEFAIAGGIPAELKTKTKPTELAQGKGGKAAINRLLSLAQNLTDALNKAADIQGENKLALLRSSIEQQFALTKDGLDRESVLLENNFEDRVVTIRKFFDERKRLQEAQIDSELQRERSLSDALSEEFSNRRADIEREFKATTEAIDRDPELKGRARDLALETAEQTRKNDLAKALNDFETQNADVSTRILILKKALLRIAEDITREEKNLTEELQRQQGQLQLELLEEQGAATEAAAGRLRAQFKDTLKELRIDVSTLSPELQEALNRVDLSVLKGRLEQLPEPVRALIQLLDIGIAKARIAERAVDVDRTLSELRLEENKIQNKVLDGVLTEREARAQILGIQQTMRGRLLDTLAAQLKIAESTKGQEDEVLRIREQIQELERLGKVVDDVGRQINQALFEDVASGIEGIFQNARRGLDGLKDAALDFLDSILNTLNRFAAQGLIEKLEGIFKPDSEDTKGTPGGILSKIFGLSPKAADTTALTTAATTAGTALTTSATAAGAALTAGGATASATLVTSLTTAAASFATQIIAAGTAFAAAVASSSASQAIGGLGGALGAATGLFPAVPGGAIHIVEGGYPEAVLTTDPKYAARQVGILRDLIQRTRGFYGRVEMPSLAAGGIVSRADAELNLLSSINRAPSFSPHIPEIAFETAASQQLMNLRILNQVSSRELTKPYLNSEEGVRDVLNIVSKNSNEIMRRLPIGRRS